MSDNATEPIEGFPLDPDEIEHMSLIPEPTLAQLDLANDGARLTLEMVREVGTTYAVFSPEFMILRSLAKSANLIRFAFTGLQLGYYGGATSVIRSAYESLLYAYLFEQRPKAVVAWVRLTLDSTLGEPEAIEEEQRLLEAAKQAFNKGTAERDLGISIWKDSSKIIHHGLEGIAAECGLHPEELLSDLSKLLESTDGDFEDAIRLLEWESRIGRSPKRQKSKARTEEFPWTGDFGSLFDEGHLEYWSTILLYLTHRMTDFIYDNFTPTVDEVRRWYRDWHTAVKSI